MVDLAIAILAETGPVEWQQNTGGHHDPNTGKWVANAPGAVQTIQAAVQPIRGIDLRDVPEGVRDEARYLLWTLSAVATDDVINYGGLKCRVVHEWPRPMDGFVKVAMGLQK